MSRYAAQTSVSADKSRAEIESLLTRYGANGFFYGWQGETALVGFTYSARMIRFELAMPPKNAREFTHTPGRGNRRSADDALAAWEQATRQRWRALGLVIKAKLEAVESKISTFEAEFLANIVMPNGQTVGAWVGPQLEQAYEHGKMPALLPGIGGTGR